MVWTPTVTVIEYADGSPVKTSVPANELQCNTLQKLLNRSLDPDGTNETIDAVAVYWTPLEKESIGAKVINVTNIVYHGYVYLQVEDRYISFDKHVSGITIQVSKDRDDVLKKCEGRPRKGVPAIIIADNGAIKVRELTKFFAQKRFFNEGYNAFTGNHCKQFTKEIFDKIAAVNHYYWEGDEQMVKLGSFATLVTLPVAAFTIAKAIGIGGAAASGCSFLASASVPASVSSSNSASASASASAPASGSTSASASASASAIACVVCGCVACSCYTDE